MDARLRVKWNYLSGKNVSRKKNRFIFRKKIVRKIFSSSLFGYTIIRFFSIVYQKEIGFIFGTKAETVFVCAPGRRAQQCRRQQPIRSTYILHRKNDQLPFAVSLILQPSSLTSSTSSYSSSRRIVSRQTN